MASCNRIKAVAIRFRFLWLILIIYLKTLLQSRKNIALRFSYCKYTDLGLNVVFNFLTNICKKQTHTSKTLYICHLAHILHYNIVF